MNYLSEEKLIIIADRRLQSVLEQAVKRFERPFLFYDDMAEFKKSNMTATKSDVVFLLANKDIPKPQNIPENNIIYYPVRLGELLDKIALCLTQKPAEPIVIGTFLLYPADYRLESDNRASTALTEKECALLLRLHEQRGDVVDRSTLLNDIWGYKDGIETHTLETHIYRLRQKIEKDPAQPALLITCDQGYCLL